MGCNQRFEPWLVLAASLLPLLAAGFLASVAYAQAPSLPAAEKGLALAQRLCSGCHVVQSETTAGVPAGVPTMRSIARRPGQTGAHIKDTLIAPSHQMPDMQLTIQEIEDLLSYFEALRNDPSQPPFNLEGVPKSKTPYPKAS